MIRCDRERWKTLASTLNLRGLHTIGARQGHVALPAGHRLLPVFVLTAYLLGFIALDRATAVFEVSPGLSVWYPPPGLSLALLLVFGLRYMPALLVGPLISGFWTYGLPGVPTVMMAVVIMGGYSLAALVLRQILRIDLQLGRIRDVSWFVLVGLLAPLVMGMLGVMGFAASAVIPWSNYFSAVLYWWIGDAIGIVLVTPFLLVHGVPWGRALIQRALTPETGAAGEGVAMPWRWPTGRPLVEILAQVASIVFGLWVAFGLEVSDEFHLVYFCFLPLIWIALRHGLPGATMGILAINIGAMLALQFSDFQLSSLAGRQVLMLVLSLTGLFLGAAVTERKRAEVELEAGNRELLALYEQVERDRTAKESLLVELNHRVRNNLAAIVSFLEIELARAEYRNADEALWACLERVRAIAKAHALLAAGAFAPVDLREFIAAVIGGMISKAEEGSAKIEVDMQGVSLKLPPKQFVALACITQELLLNAVKHAFRGKERGRIEIRTWEEGERCILEVRDDGMGFADEARGEGSGLAIIATLCRADLRGDCLFSQDGGTVARISFPKPVIEVGEAR